MLRKDCERAACIVLALAGVGFLTPSAQAGTIRMWSSAVTSDGAVRLGDVAELLGFGLEEHRRLSALEVGPGPDAGGSRYLSLDAVRAALRDGGFNLADIRVQGASQCAVSRPAAPSGAGSEEGSSATLPGGLQSADGTLRDAVSAFIKGELERYGGQVEISFDRGAAGVLDLSAPAYGFDVRRRGGTPLGLTPVEVDVLAGGKIVQTVSLVVQVRLSRAMLTARRAINQDARIRAEDVDVTMMAVSRLDQAGLEDVNAVIGQRAKRFIPPGMTLTPDMLESVPLVRRGELVTLEATVGGVSIVTTAKADEDGRLHEVIRVRSLDGRRDEFDGVVVGAGKVRIGGPREPGEALALGGIP
jgi:flagella basal body P-ring formation protein FlgA